ncbi:MAG: hypothetical protein RL454_417 [Actinomycetota bacterium]
MRRYLTALVAGLLWTALALQEAGFALWLIPVLSVVVLVLGFPGLAFGVRASLLAFPATVVLRALTWPGTIESPIAIQSLGASLRVVVRRNLGGVSPNAEALTLGITDGDSSMLPKTLVQELNNLSLSHLTAVSGTNCSILIASLMVVGSWLGLRRAARMTLGLFGLAGYLILVGDQPSVIRAAAMGVVVVLGLSGGIRFSSVDLLAFTVVGLFLVDPSFSTNLGFGLSVAATAGVLLLAEPLATRLAWLPRWLALPTAVAMAAQFACLPLLVAIQGNFNLGGLAANLLAEPVVAPITVLGLLGALLGLLGHPVGLLVGMPFLWLASLPSQFILLSSHFLAENFPSISLPGGAGGCAIAALMLFLLIWWLSPRAKLAWLPGLVLLVIALLLTSQLLSRLGVGSFPGDRWIMVSCDVGQGDATVLQAGRHFAVIDVGRDPGPINRCLHKLGIIRIDLLVLTHFDLDHVGGLAGALEGRSVRQALTTQFVDSRPGARDCERLLRQEGVPYRKVALGETGVLGSAPATRLEWLALTPHPGGEGSTSSNDGSVAMLWHGNGVNIFTMADLPASGQARIMAERSMWWRQEFAESPTILKLSHHGSADQLPEFLAWVHPVVTTISVGAENPYGHPTNRALRWLARFSGQTLRTDQNGSISLGWQKSNNQQGRVLVWASSGAG